MFLGKKSHYKQIVSVILLIKHVIIYLAKNMENWFRKNPQFMQLITLSDTKTKFSLYGKLTNIEYCCFWMTYFQSLPLIVIKNKMEYDRKNLVRYRDRQQKLFQK